MGSDDRRGRLAQWFRELRGPLRHFLARRRGTKTTDLDDVAQEVFLRLLRYEHGEPISDPRAYLFKIAANVASEWSMRASNRLPHESSWLDDLHDNEDMTREIDRMERDSQIYEAIGELPPRAREILRLHFGEGLQHEAISARMGLTRRVVKRDIISAYATLRFILAPGMGPNTAFDVEADKRNGTDK